jgi:long-chain acyl-CoA synthetase
MADLSTLHDLIADLPRHGAQPALLAVGEGERRWSYAELADQIGRLAGGLAAEGIEQGQSVVVFAPNSPESIVATLALVRLGAVPVPLDVRLGKKQLAHCLADSQSRTVFSTSDAVTALLDSHPDPTTLRVISLDRDRPEAAGDAAAHRFANWWQDLLADAPADGAAPAPDDTAVLFYTSGTTGVPKGVPLTHRNLVHNVEGLLAGGIVQGPERVLLPLPLHHVYPFTVGMLVPLRIGSTIVLPAGISGSEIQAALRDGAVTVVIGVPRLYQALMEAIRRRVGSGGLAARAFAGMHRLARRTRERTGLNLGRVLFRPLHRRLAPDLRLMVAGGSRLDPALAADLEGLGWDVLTGYGLTETSPIVAFNAPRYKNLASAGRPLRGLTVEIRPLEGKEGGEITVKGPSVFAGYRNLEEETKQAFTEDGYFRTGDIGRLDEAGFLEITARVKETIVLPAGENIYPEEVETAFLASDLIAEAAVLEHDDRLALLVVPDPKALRARGVKEAGPAIEKEVKRISGRLPSYQRIARIAVTKESLPRTTLGKLRRHELPPLVERALKGEPPPEGATELSAADESLLKDPRAGRTWDWLKARYPDRRFTPDSSLFTDVGIDSLDWVGASLDIEREIGVRLEGAAIARIETVRDLLEAVQAAEAGDGGEPGALTAEEEVWLAEPGPGRRAAARLASGLNTLLLRTLCRLTVEGQEHLPAEGPFVLAPNHTSYLDPPVLMAALPAPMRKRTYWAGDEGVMFGSAPRRAFSRLFNVFPVSVMQARSALSFGRAILERGHVLTWFPEGRRSEDGRLLPFEAGIGQLAELTGARIVPVHIRGAYEAWPVAATWPRPYPIAVRFGPPVDPAPLMAEARGDPRKHLAEKLHAAVAALG